MVVTQDPVLMVTVTVTVIRTRIKNGGETRSSVPLKLSLPKRDYLYTLGVPLLMRFNRGILEHIRFGLYFLT